MINQMKQLINTAVQSTIKMKPVDVKSNTYIDSSKEIVKSKSERVQNSKSNQKKM